MNTRNLGLFKKIKPFALFLMMACVSAAGNVWAETPLYEVHVPVKLNNISPNLQAIVVCVDFLGGGDEEIAKDCETFAVSGSDYSNTFVLKYSKEWFKNVKDKLDQIERFHVRIHPQGPGADGAIFFTWFDSENVSVDWAKSKPGTKTKDEYTGVIPLASDKRAELRKKGVL